MKRVVLIVALALVTIGLTWPSTLLAGSGQSGLLIDHKTFAERKAFAQESNTAVTKEMKTTSAWRVTFGRILTFLKWPAIGVVIMDDPDTEPDRPLLLQDPPWEEPPMKDRDLDKEDHGWGDT